MQSAQDNSVLLYGQRVARYQAFIEDIDSLKTTCLNHLSRLQLKDAIDELNQLRKDEQALRARLENRIQYQKILINGQPEDTPPHRTPHAIQHGNILDNAFAKYHQQKETLVEMEKALARQKQLDQGLTFLNEEIDYQTFLTTLGGLSKDENHPRHARQLLLDYLFQCGKQFGVFLPKTLTDGNQEAHNDYLHAVYTELVRKYPSCFMLVRFLDQGVKEREEMALHFGISVPEIHRLYRSITIALQSILSSFRRVYQAEHNEHLRQTVNFGEIEMYFFDNVKTKIDEKQVWTQDISARGYWELLLDKMAIVFIGYMDAEYIQFSQSTAVSDWIEGKYKLVPMTPPEA